MRGYAFLVFLLLIVFIAFTSDRFYESIPFEPIDQQREAVKDGVYGERSGDWPRVRADFVRLHPVCEACGTKKDLNVHHIVPFHLDSSLELDPKNLITLCREHHFRIGHDPDGPWLPRKPNWYDSNPNVRRDALAVRKGRKVR